MRSVLDQLDRKDVRLHQPRYLTLPLSSTRVRGHTLPLVAMHHIDRSCMIVGKFFEVLRSPTPTPITSSTNHHWS